MSGNNNDYEDVILSVTATPLDGKPIIKDYPITTESGIISRETVPIVSGNNANQVIVQSMLDSLKEQFNANEQKLVVKYREKEVIDNGWFTHFDMSFGLGLDKGKIDAKVVGTPKKRTILREQIIEAFIEDKNNKP
jgi:hypothetical protein